jgi:hypothetical protein
MRACPVCGPSFVGRRATLASGRRPSQERYEAGTQSAYDQHDPQDTENGADLEEREEESGDAKHDHCDSDELKDALGERSIPSEELRPTAHRAMLRNALLRRPRSTATAPTLASARPRADVSTATSYLGSPPAVDSSGRSIR